jgi:hypothetical protein
MAASRFKFNSSWTRQVSRTCLVMAAADGGVTAFAIFAFVAPFVAAALFVFVGIKRPLRRTRPVRGRKW